MSKGASLGESVARAIDLTKIETPCFVTDLPALEANLEILADVQRRAECTILLALKGFAQWSTFPLIRRYLSGATASSIAEARLDRKSTRLNSSHMSISYAVFCLKKKKKQQ